MPGVVKRPPLGLTLIEMMIVLAIIGIIVLAVLPVLNSHDNEKKVTAAATELANALRFARSNGISFRVAALGGVGTVVGPEPVRAGAMVV